MLSQSPRRLQHSTRALREQSFQQDLNESKGPRTMQPRLISAALIPLTIAPFAAGSLNPVMDAALCATIIIHSHIGFESIIIDYVPIKRLPKTRALFWWGLRAATLGVAVGLYEFETNDVGLTEAVKRIWTA
ncbi:membrane anchor subunit of succinate dehydrogenase, Sdh4 [Toensbergia leucococca]|nr:membrane anchor subunit of succinate dehydrogenase, Sdh4 [Toensbergia leucococca]